MTAAPSWRSAFLTVAEAVTDGLPVPVQVRDNGNGLMCLDLTTHEDLQLWAEWFEITPSPPSRYRAKLVQTGYGQWRGWSVQLLAITQFAEPAPVAGAIPTGVEGYSISGRDGVEVLHVCHGCREPIAVADQRSVELSTGTEYWHDRCLSKETVSTFVSGSTVLEIPS
jgi:hypothetical protein